MSVPDRGRPRRVVVTAAIFERDGSFLVTRRPEGVHLSGHWEFPGGKYEPGERFDACLAREIREELDAEIAVGAEVLSVSHAYPEREVELHFFRCELLTEPRPMLGQEMTWVSRDALGSLDFPAADEALIDLLTAS